MKNLTANYFPLLFLVLIGYSGIAQEDEWKFKREKDDIKVYIKENSNSNINDVKATTTYKSSLASLIAVSMDVATYNDWVYSSKEAKVLESISESEVIYYTESEAPWPFQNRDVVLHSKVTQDPETKVVTIHSQTIEDYYPEKEGIVRVPRLIATWILTPMPNGDVDALYYVSTDPGGNVPAWLINMFIDKGPIESFNGLRKRALQEPYKSAQLAYIID